MLDWISCYSFAEEDGYVYLSNAYYNGLFKVEIRTGKTLFLGGFEHEPFFELSIHIEVLKRNERVYFLPHKGRHVHIYNLLDGKLDSVEIKQKTESFYVIKDVIDKGDLLYLLPEKKNQTIKKLDLQSLEVSEEVYRSEIEGEYLRNSREIFPEPRLLKKMHVQLPIWKQLADKKWYGFLPRDRQLARYVERTDKIERIPLVIENEEKLKKYLKDVKREASIKISRGEIFREGRLDFQDFLNVIIKMRVCKALLGRGKVGEEIWKSIRL